MYFLVVVFLGCKHLYCYRAGELFKQSIDYCTEAKASPNPISGSCVVLPDRKATIKESNSARLYSKSQYDTVTTTTAFPRIIFSWFLIFTLIFDVFL